MRKLLINPNTYVSLVILVYGGFFLQPIFRNIKELHRLRTSKPTGIVADATEVDSSESDESQDNVPEMLLPDEMETAQQTLYELKRRHTGFAFSGEAGHAPQITDPGFFYKNQ